jgi:hypothetical protein
VRPKRPKAAGILPVLLECPDEDREREWVVNTALRLAETRSVGILLRDHSREQGYIERLEGNGVRVTRLHRNMTIWHGGFGVWIGTHYAAKGIEFDAVIIPCLGDAELPDPHRVNVCGDEDEACIDEVKLVYVAVTRAKSELIMTYSLTPSRVLSDVPAKLYRSARLP